MAAPQKICSDCKAEKPIGSFYCNRGSNDGHLGICKKCYYLKHRAYKARYDKLKNSEVRKRVFAHYGGTCFCCGEANPKFLTLDHANDDGASERRLKGKTLYLWLEFNNYPQDLGLRVACWNCNCARHFNGGICPHEEDKQAVLHLVAG